MISASLFVKSLTARVSIQRVWSCDRAPRRGVLLVGPLVLLVATSLPSASQPTAYNFGSVSVGSSATTTITYNITSSVTLGSNPSVTTQGAAGLDFTQTGTTCVGAQTAPTNCTVTVQFAPSATGPRYGAVQIFDASGNPIFTTLLQGLGQAPAVVFVGGAQTVVPVTGLSGPSGVTVDAAGDVFVADAVSNSVLEIPKGCTAGSCQATIATGLNNPHGIAVDGAGDVLAADTGNNRVLEVPSGCTATSCQTTVGSGPFTPSALALDGAGDVFIADSLNNQVLEVPAGCTAASCQTTVGFGQFSPSAVALDGAGDLFIADTLNHQVLEVPVGCTSSSCQVTLASGLGLPAGLVVDAAGDVFVSDASNNRVLEIPAGCASSTCQISIGSGLSSPMGVSADALGDLFIADYGNARVVGLQNSQAIPLSFGAVPINSTSSVQTVTVQNIGNAPLTFSSIAATTNFAVEGGTTTCSTSSSYSLAPGATCNVGVACTASAIGSLTGTLSLGDNSLDGSPTTQLVSLSCTGQGNAPTLTSTNNAAFSVGVLSTFMVTTSGLPIPSLSESGALPGGITFQDNGNGTATLSGTPLAGSGGTYSITITATNGISPNGTQFFTLVVDQAPSITSSNKASFTSGVAGTFTVVTTGYPTPSLSESGTLPNGISFQDKGNGTAILSGTPAGSGGTYSITITAANGIAPNGTQSFTLAVGQSPQPPAITSSNAATFTSGTAGAFTVVTTGYPTPSLSESGTLPSGITFQDNGNGTATLGGTPLAGSGGTYSITITAANGISPNGTQSFTLAVDQPPAITSGNNTTFQIGTAGAFTVTTSSYPTASLSDSGASLPSGISFQDNGNGTATLGGTPASGSGGVYDFTITAQNGVLPNATQSFTLTVPAQLTAGGAARFLEQSSWGPTAATIAAVQNSGLSAYLQQQFSAPISVYPSATALSQAQEQFFINAMGGQDQLRQRVSFALSEIMVISNLPDTISYTAFPLWMNTLQNDAFGNFYQLLHDVTLNPGMGTYLNMAQNNGCATCRPNENYARELMQLFSIGLDELNPDGSLILDGNGNPIPTYTQNTVDGFSQAFSGWSYPAAPGKKAVFTDPANYTGPMIPFQAEYNTGSKLLLNGVTLPAGGNITTDLSSALENIFNHPNVGPFICKQLIQKLVTSNPIPGYISRCSEVFDNDGTGVRGNLQAVVSEILLDPEARRGDEPTQVEPTDGHLREPLLFMVFALRALNATTNAANLLSIAQSMGQEPFSSPSVFNFYPPGYVIPGLGILGPEFYLNNNSSTLARANFISSLLYTNMSPNTVINIAPYVAVAGNVQNLLNMINANLMHGAMPSDMYNTLLTTLSNKAFSTPTLVAEAALYLVLTSSQFNVED